MERFEDVLAEELRVLSSWPWMITPEAAGQSVDSAVDPSGLWQALSADPRFVPVALCGGTPYGYVSDQTLFRRLVFLNLRLAEAGCFWLPERQVAGALSVLRQEGAWRELPRGLRDWGHGLGLIASSPMERGFVFPLARVLSWASRSSLTVAREVLAEFGDARIWTMPLRQLACTFLEAMLGAFGERAAYVVRSREGLSGEKVTLGHLAQSLGVTRERIRQIEKRFWEAMAGLPRPKPRALRSAWMAFLCDLMARGGALVAPISSPGDTIRTFLARCVGVPFALLPEAGCTVLAATAESVAPLRDRDWFPEEIDPLAIVRRLVSLRLYLSDSDVRALADAVAGWRRKSLTKAQKVYIALRRIGRPAHYTEVAEMCNQIWPEETWSAHNVHAILSRQEYDVVWVGRRGTFALGQWGYDRPGEPLFDAVAEIVRTKYGETGRPVPYAVIVAEVGKRRRLVNPASIALAVHCNKRIRRTSKDGFLPMEPEAGEDNERDNLDRILREFQRTLPADSVT